MKFFQWHGVIHNSLSFNFYSSKEDDTVDTIIKLLNSPTEVFKEVINNE